MKLAEYKRYLYEIEMRFTRRVDSGSMSEKTYCRLVNKLDEWPKMAEGVSA